MTRWGAPPDVVAWTCAVVGTALLFHFLATRGRGLLGLPRQRYLLAVSILSGLLSAGYVAYYLQGGPRIIDATSYFLQARTYANFELGFSPPEPSAAHFGRFLLSMPDGRLSVLFPPGYPSFLALGFLAGAPLAMGPLLAMGLVWAVYWLASNLFDDERVARLAALLSALCAVLRYHTADTMSHGLSALLLLIAAAAASSPRSRFAPLGGLCLGWLFATRPLSGVVAAVLVGVILSTQHRTTSPGARKPPFDWNDLSRRLVGFAACFFGIGALVLQQRAVTGSWFESSQYHYYSLADELGCFRYGFGSDVGCGIEHGDFVEQYMPHGYGIVEAVGTTARRLMMHLGDAGNQELFALVLVAAIVVGGRRRGVRVLAFGVVLQILLYAGFYFDGNYPGGGARMFADVLPLEHILIAWALVHLRIAGVAAPLMLLGFAFHTAHDHRQLSEREGGRPMYDASFVGKKLTHDVLVYVATDHGYNLAFDPSGRSGITIARSKGDALDFASFAATGATHAYRYGFDIGDDSVAELIPFLPKPTTRFELEQQWPPASLRGGHALRRLTPTPCGDTGGLELTPSGPLVEVETVLWAPAPGAYSLSIIGTEIVGVSKAGRSLAATQTPTLGACRQTVVRLSIPRRGDVSVALWASRRTWLDYVELQPLEPKTGSRAVWPE